MEKLKSENKQSKRQNELIFRVWDESQSKYINPSHIYLKTDGTFNYNQEKLVIEQSTGRKVGDKFLYEGDICSDCYGGILEVVWRLDAWYFKSLGNTTFNYARIRDWFDCDCDLKIIGNIHQNKDDVQRGGM